MNYDDKQSDNPMPNAAESFAAGRKVIDSISEDLVRLDRVIQRLASCAAAPPANMPHEVSPRGFTSMEPVTCRYGSTVLVSESSSAEEPCIWLRVTVDTMVLTKQEPGEGVAHLSMEQAMMVRDQLSWLIANHYQVKESGE